ncbi:MAG: hypothetical protein QOJ99_5880 [Bryobacterales bacterium]|jgi:hypothetical protein|nr:hypothetical protein [Bryobacterales bacterium]
MIKLRIVPIDTEATYARLHRRSWNGTVPRWVIQPFAVCSDTAAAQAFLVPPVRYPQDNSGAVESPDRPKVKRAVPVSCALDQPNYVWSAGGTGYGVVQQQFLACIV